MPVDFLSVQRPYVVIVTGIPRSGTSLMMQMLRAGGLPLLTDGLRAADAHNPRGYFELEAVKRTREDPSWLKDARGRAVKMVYRLLYDLPAEGCYRVVFMRRELDEVLASQRRMLARRETRDSTSDEEMAAFFRRELEHIEQWRTKQPAFRFLDVNYHDVLADPAGVCQRIDRFLGGGLDVSAMRSVVDPALYRNRRRRAGASST